MMDLCGSYSLVRNENLEEYMSKVGVPYLARKMMSKSSPTLTISQAGEKWKVEVKTLMRTTLMEFKLGEEFDDSLPSGATFKSKAELEGNMLRITSKETGNGDMERSYSLEDNELVMVLKSSEHDIVAKRYFKRIDS